MFDNYPILKEFKAKLGGYKTSIQGVNGVFLKRNGCILEKEAM